jgi:hypothetical protein
MNENQLAMQQSKMVFNLVLAERYLDSTLFYDLPNEVETYNFLLSCFNKDEEFNKLGEGDIINFY